MNLNDDRPQETRRGALGDRYCDRGAGGVSAEFRAGVLAGQPGASGSRDSRQGYRPFVWIAGGDGTIASVLKWYGDLDRPRNTTANTITMVGWMNFFLSL